jgi:acyl-CoA synthetase (AMP-forming)/AMP-acid ligase II
VYARAGSTEGNAALVNICTDKRSQGACGHAGFLLSRVLPVQLVKFDVVEEEPMRDAKTGFCIPCPRGEPGELLGRIDNDDPTRKFDGYHGNKEATSKKIAQNVFVKGDQWFRTGDLLIQDNDGYFYFVDRIGDTFRYKGENVSTNEVAGVLSTHPAIEEANVYGVQVPGADGQPPVAAIVLTEAAQNDPEAALADLVQHCKAHLPAYAIPVYLRILERVAVTVTFKHQKVTLRKDGVDPSVVNDVLLRKVKDSYTRLTVEEYARIITPTARL